MKQKNKNGWWPAVHRLFLFCDLATMEIIIRGERLNVATLTSVHAWKEGSVLADGLRHVAAGGILLVFLEIAWWIGFAGFIGRKIRRMRNA
jgi:hypothetical protein